MAKHASTSSLRPSTSYKPCAYDTSRLTSLSPTSAARQARRTLLRRVHRQELRRLQQLVPVTLRARLPSGQRTAARECAILHSAVRYIDALHATILARVANGTLSEGGSTHLFA
jgi:hypothetical protein